MFIKENLAVQKMDLTLILNKARKAAGLVALICSLTSPERIF